MNSIAEYLFKTDAIRICPENKPFWYTSGKIGPYYINTHFIYSNEQDANNLLRFIDDNKDNKEELPKKVFEETLKHYNTSEIYKNVINQAIEFIKENIDVNEIDYVSGGERRDWFFSNIIANKLGKPHISIFKDLSVVINDNNFENVLRQTIEPPVTYGDSPLTKGAKVLHIADLITEAVSYSRAWIPAVNGLGGKIVWSVSIVDRLQGGKDKLENEGIKSLSIVSMDSELFVKALELGIINQEQLKMLNKYTNDPDETMKEFIKSHPDFLENALNSDEYEAARARLCIEGKFYE